MTGADPDAAQDRAATVRSFLALLEKGDIGTWIGLWADDAVQYYPYGTEMFPARLSGKDAIHTRWKDMPGYFVRLGFPLRDLWECGDTVIARFDGDCVLRDGERPYQNSYIAVFKFDGAGRIGEYWEYFDPIRAAAAFNLADITYRT